MIDLKSLKRSVHKEAPVICLYGAPGVGKSTLAASFPNPVFVPVEDVGPINMVNIFGAGNKAQSTSDVKDAIEALSIQDHNFNTVVIDSISSYEHLLWSEVCQKANPPKPNIEAFGYQEGFRIACDTWQVFFENIKRLRRDKGIAVVMISHETTAKVKHPLHGEFNAFFPAIHTLAREILVRTCDGVFALQEEVFTKKEETGFNKKNTYGIGTGRRIIYTSNSPARLAKNRWSLPPEISVDGQNGYDAISDAINAFYTAKESKPKTSKGE